MIVKQSVQYKIRITYIWKAHPSPNESIHIVLFLFLSYRAHSNVTNTPFRCDSGHILHLVWIRDAAMTTRSFSVSKRLLLRTRSWHAPSHVIVAADQGTFNWYVNDVRAATIQYTDVAEMEFESTAERAHPRGSVCTWNHEELIQSNCSLRDISIPSSDPTDRIVWNWL